MKNSVLIISAIGVLVCCLQSELHAQGTLYFSNLNGPPDGGPEIFSPASAGDIIETGSDASGYILNSIQLGMSGASGNPSGFSVSLYTVNGLAPGQDLGLLNGPDNPSTAGNYTYTTSGVFLAPSTEYYIVATDATDLSAGHYIWAEAGPVISSTDGWQVVSGGDNISGSWTSSTRGIVAVGIYATAVPEPDVSLLLLIAGTLPLVTRKMRKAV